MDLSPIKKKWLIWSFEHNAFWKSGCCGYSTKRIEAGRYSFEEACFIVHDGNRFVNINKPHEAMICDTDSVYSFVPPTTFVCAYFDMVG